MSKDKQQETHLIARKPENDLVKLTCNCGWNALTTERFTIALESRHIRLNSEKGK